VAAEGAVGPLHYQFRSPVAGASGTPVAESGSRAWINAINARQPIVELYSVRAAAAPLRFEIPQQHRRKILCTSLSKVLTYNIGL
jgi:hypothetical protein